MTEEVEEKEQDRPQVFRVCDLYPGRWPNDRRKVKLEVIEGKTEIVVVD